jgi:hypothetical protein
MRDWAGYTVHDPVIHMQARRYAHKSSAVRRARRYSAGQVATVQQWDSACDPLGQWRIEGQAEPCP